MKRIIVIIATLLLAWSAWGVPAKPGAFNYKQPDGSIVRLERHGDEFFSWTTLAGTNQVVKLDAKGFWRNSTIDPAAREAADQFRRQVNSQRSSLQPRTHDQSKIMTHGARHIPVFLVNFQDVSFSISNPAEQFNALLNENGYSANGATGSAQDYFMDNSHGEFQPIFDVYGPVTLPHEMKYYGEPVKNDSGEITKNDIRPEIAVFDAAKLLDSSVDFSQYDVDNDGYVDMVMLYFAGYNQAEGADENTLWPHQWNVQSSSSSTARNTTFDGIKLRSYFMTSELKDTEGVNMCGIGTTCHEFGHSLGLPDFYDTDYEKNGKDHGLNYFSIMSSGNYLNEGRTPPYYNAEERICLGWMTESDLQELQAGPISFGSVKDDIAFISRTDTDGEYFLYECRDGSGWDSYVSRGLLIYHVDKSTVRTVGGITPLEQWEQWRTYNSINAYGDHPCFILIPSSAQTNLNYSSTDLRTWVFPGSSKITSFIPKDWDGYDTGLEIADISYDDLDKKVTLTANYSTERILKGLVSDYSGKPLEGVHVVLTKQETSNAPRLLKKGVRNNSPVFETVTDADGQFSLDVEAFGSDQGHVTLSKEGYQTIGYDITLSRHITKVEYMMKSSAQGELKLYSYWDPTGKQYFYGDGETNSLMAAIRIPAEEVPFNGGTLLSISFYPIWEAESYYAIVDAGQKRLHTVPLTIKDTQSFQKVSLDLPVPGGEDLYIGYAIVNAQTIVYNGVDYTGYLFAVTGTGNNIYMDYTNLETSDWSDESQDTFALMLDAEIMENVEEEPEEDVTSFAEMGVPAIPDPGNGTYAAGDVFQLNMPLPEGVKAQVSWKFDGLTVTDPVTLQAGKHTVTAILNYEDGSVETIDLLIEVK